MVEREVDRGFSSSQAFAAFQSPPQSSLRPDDDDDEVEEVGLVDEDELLGAGDADGGGGVHWRPSQTAASFSR